MTYTATHSSANRNRRNPTQAYPAIETMETRQMLSISLTSGSTISQITDYAVYAEARMGSNGDPWGIAELVAGTSSEEIGWSSREWDNNPYDGFDSGWINFTFALDMNAGCMSWTLQGADTITCYGDFGSTIGQVDIRAAVVTNGMAFAFSDVEVQFYDDESLLDWNVLISCPAVDTLESQNTSPAESLAQVTPNTAGATKVLVTGSLRLQAAQGVYPDWSDLFGDIYIHEAA